MRTLITLLLFLAASTLYSQSNMRHGFSAQFGGQLLYGVNYEYLIYRGKNIQLNTIIGPGRNEYADDTDPNDRAIRGIQTGINSSIKIWKKISFDFSIVPTTYFYRKTTFLNLNGWIGSRFYIEKNENTQFSFAIGYTPRFYSTYSDPYNKFNDIKLGIKFIVNTN